MKLHSSYLALAFPSNLQHTVGAAKQESGMPNCQLAAKRSTGRRDAHEKSARIVEALDLMAGASVVLFCL